MSSAADGNADADFPVVVDTTPVVVESVPMAADRVSRGSAAMAWGENPELSQRGDLSKPDGGLNTSGRDRATETVRRGACDTLCGACNTLCEAWENAPPWCKMLATVIIVGVPLGITVLKILLSWDFHGSGGGSYHYG